MQATEAANGSPSVGAHAPAPAPDGHEEHGVPHSTPAAPISGPCPLAPMHKEWPLSKAERRCIIIRELDRLMAGAEAMASTRQLKKPKLSIPSATPPETAQAAASSTPTHASTRSCSQQPNVAASLKQEPNPPRKPIKISPSVRFSASLKQQQPQQPRHLRGASAMMGNVIRLASRGSVPGASIVACRFRRHVGLRSVYAHKARRQGPNPLQPDPEEVEVTHTEPGEDAAAPSQQHQQQRPKQLGPRTGARGSGHNWTGWLTLEQAVAQAAEQERLAQQQVQQQQWQQQQARLQQAQQAQQAKQAAAAAPPAGMQAALQGGGPAGMQGGMQAALQGGGGGMGGMQAALQGAGGMAMPSGGMQAAMQGAGGMGGMQSAMPGAGGMSMQGGMQAALQASAGMSMQGGMQAAMQGSGGMGMQAALQGMGLPGGMSMQGGMQAGLHGGGGVGGMQAALQGGGMQAAMQGGGMSGIQAAMQGGASGMGGAMPPGGPQQLQAAKIQHFLDLMSKNPQVSPELIQQLRTDPLTLQRAMATFFSQRAQQQQMGTGM